MFLLSWLGSAIFWSVYMLVGIFMTVFLIRVFCPLLTEHFRGNSKPSPVENSSFVYVNGAMIAIFEIWLVPLLVFIFWLPISIVYLFHTIVKVFGLLFGFLFKELFTFLDKNIPEITIKKK